ncbi:hypothetical protein NDU88_002890 [Pleurodeles waltl]|uniref:Uncharacterized protein n=1 Tax=Pleurodeles waltl TaxID=8319 RepID=A0AAV7W0L7_PLEWA|nr:hypothetical protein NDU88_002890 [Pleurodeles waltl]
MVLGWKIDTVAVEVILLQADLRKVSDKVKVAEGSIVDLQTEVGTLRKQMAQLNCWDIRGLARVLESVQLALLEWMVRTEEGLEMAHLRSLRSDVMKDSVSRIEIQQDGTMAVVDPEQFVKLAGPLDMEVGVLSLLLDYVGP